MSQVHYREAGIADVGSIAQVNSDTLRECGLATPEIYNVERLRLRWDAYIRRVGRPQHSLEPRIVFAATVENRMVGYIAGHLSTRHNAQGELQSIYVLREFQRRAIGTSLLDRLAGWFIAHDSCAVCVGIDPANPYKKFYEKQGASYINPHWLIWHDISQRR